MEKNIENLLRKEIELHSCRIDELAKLILLYKLTLASKFSSKENILFENLESLKNRMKESEKNFRKILDDLNGN
jgi:hypothetical protein